MLSHIHKNGIEFLSLCVFRFLFYARLSKFSLISELKSNFLALLWNEEEIQLVLASLSLLISFCPSLSLCRRRRRLWFAIIRCTNFFHCYSNAICYRFETLVLYRCRAWLLRSFVRSLLHSLFCVFSFHTHTHNDGQNREKITPFLHFVA